MPRALCVSDAYEERRRREKDGEEDGEVDGEVDGEE